MFYFTAFYTGLYLLHKVCKLSLFLIILLVLRVHGAKRATINFGSISHVTKDGVNQLYSLKPFIYQNEVQTT